MDDIDHVVVEAKPGGGCPDAVCLRCGYRYTISMPCPVEILVAISDAFTALHKNCEPRDETSGVPEMREEETRPGLPHMRKEIDGSRQDGAGKDPQG